MLLLIFYSLEGDGKVYTCENVGAVCVPTGKIFCYFLSGQEVEGSLYSGNTDDNKTIFSVKLGKVRTSVRLLLYVTLFSSDTILIFFYYCHRLSEGQRVR